MLQRQLFLKWCLWWRQSENVSHFLLNGTLEWRCLIIKQIKHQKTDNVFLIHVSSTTRQWVPSNPNLIGASVKSLGENIFPAPSFESSLAWTSSSLRIRRSPAASESSSVIGPNFYERQVTNSHKLFHRLQFMTKLCARKRAGFRSGASERTTTREIRQRIDARTNAKRKVLKIINLYRMRGRVHIKH